MVRSILFLGLDCCPLTGRSLQDALRTSFQPIKTDDPRVDSYTMYKRESSEYDTDYVKKYDKDFNTTLVFVRCLSAYLVNYLTYSCRPACSPPSAPPSSLASIRISNPIPTSNPPLFSAPPFSPSTNPPFPVRLLPGDPRWRSATATSSAHHISAGGLHNARSSTPPEFRRYQFSHCFPSIAMDATNNDTRRLAYIRHAWSRPRSLGLPERAERWCFRHRFSPSSRDSLRLRPNAPVNENTEEFARSPLSRGNQFCASYHVF